MELILKWAIKKYTSRRGPGCARDTRKAAYNYVRQQWVVARAEKSKRERESREAAARALAISRRFPVAQSRINQRRRRNQSPLKRRNSSSLSSSRARMLLPMRARCSTRACARRSAESAREPLEEKKRDPDNGLIRHCPESRPLPPSLSLTRYSSSHLLSLVNVACT